MENTTPALDVGQIGRGCSNDLLMNAVPDLDERRMPICLADDEKMI